MGQSLGCVLRVVGSMAAAGAAAASATAPLGLRGAVAFAWLVSGYLALAVFTLWFIPSTIGAPDEAAASAAVKGGKGADTHPKPLNPEP